MGSEMAKVTEAVVSEVNVAGSLRFYYRIILEEGIETNSVYVSLEFRKRTCALPL